MFVSACIQHTDTEVSDKISVYLDGERLEFDVSPMIIDYHIMMPFCALFEALGAEIHWFNDESVSALIGVTPFNAGFQFHIRSNILQVNISFPLDGKTIMLDVAPIIVDNRMFVPLQAISKPLRVALEWCEELQGLGVDIDWRRDYPMLGTSVEWNEKTQTVLINTESNEVNDKIIFDVNIETDEVLVDDRVAWKVAYARDELLNKYDSYVDFIDDDISEELALLIYTEELRLAFLPYITLYDFQWIEVGFNEVENILGYQFYQRSVLYSVGDLQSGVPFVVTALNQPIPHRGISFVDENGKRRYFAINRKQAEPDEREGSFIILEF